MTGLEGLAAILFVCMMPVALVWISRHYEYKCKLLEHERATAAREHQVLQNHGENMVVAAERLLQAARTMHGLPQVSDKRGLPEHSIEKPEGKWES